MNSRDVYCLTFQTGMSNIELEKIISKDCHYSYYYAHNILKGRFKLGEKTIVQYSYSYFYYSIDYSLNILRHDHE